MHDAILQTIVSNAKAVIEAWDKLTSTIEQTIDGENNRISPEQKLPKQDYSISEIAARIIALNGFSQSTSISSKGILVPGSLLDAFAVKLQELKAQIDSATNLILNPQKQGGGIRKINSETFKVAANNGQVLDFSNPLRRIFGALDASLVAWFQIAAVIENPKMDELGNVLNLLSERYSESVRLADEGKRLKESIEQDQVDGAELLSRINLEKEEIGRLLQESQNDRKTLNEYSAEAAEKLATVRSVHQDASSLSVAVSEFKTDFDRFDQQLATREEKFQKENDELQEIHRRLDVNEKEVVRLLDEVEGMLRGATNVGMAASFSNLQGKINDELRGARISFYVSIGLLVVLTLPIAIYVFPGLSLIVKHLFPSVDPEIFIPKKSGDHATIDVAAQVIARALLLIPGVWLVRFTAARHERLFRLREHYAYKFSIASSVEGFKKQAPDLEQGIAAAAFHELTFNPATRMDANSKEVRHPNPVMDWILGKLGGETKTKS